MPRDSILLSETQLKKLNELMNKQNLTKEKLAEKAACNVRTITRLFAGEAKDRKTVIAVCIALGTTLDELLAPPIPLADPAKVLDTEQPNNVVVQERPLVQGEPLTASHLVIAVFWQEKSKQKLRVRPKLCLRHPHNPQEITKKPLLEDDKDGEISLKQFPNYLQTLVEFIEPILMKEFEALNEPWQQSVIRLFLPVDLLQLPPADLIGNPITEVHNHPVVIGCSDRFDRHNLARSAKLVKTIKTGWQRFQKHAPDGQPLNNLQWLSSNQAHQANLATYSGFRCLGNWLKAEEAYLANWLALVESGIPLALWGWEWTRGNPTLTAFEHLTSYNRFGFLEQLPQLRQESYQLGNKYFGVFYEDPGYSPDVPPPQTHFFSFPGT